MANIYPYYTMCIHSRHMNFSCCSMQKGRIVIWLLCLCAMVMLLKEIDEVSVGQLNVALNRLLHFRFTPWTNVVQIIYYRLHVCADN